jgi:hypothetical protein
MGGFEEERSIEKPGREHMRISIPFSARKPKAIF